MKSLKLQTFLPYRLSVVSNQISDLIAELYRDRFGLSIWQWRVIALIGTEGEHTAQQVAIQAAMDKMTVSRAVSGLVQRDLVRRMASTTDRRSHMLHLTTQGRKIHDEIAPLAKQQEQMLLAGMSEADIEQLFSILTRLEKKVVMAKNNSNT